MWTNNRKLGIRFRWRRPVMWIMQISRSWKKLFPIYEQYEHKYQYNADISAYNSEEGEAQRIEETEKLVYDSEEDEDICETCMQTQEIEESPLNSEESASNSEDDEDICTACLQLR